jgi:hypothetical protein
MSLASHFAENIVQYTLCCQTCMGNEIGMRKTYRTELFLFFFTLFQSSIFCFKVKTRFCTIIDFLDVCYPMSCFFI